jgi:hypothetical protein
MGINKLRLFFELYFLPSRLCGSDSVRIRFCFEKYLDVTSTVRPVRTIQGPNSGLYI